MEAEATSRPPQETVLLILSRRKWLEVESIEQLSLVNRQWREWITRHRLWRRALAQYGFPLAQQLRFWLREARIEQLIPGISATKTDAEAAESQGEHGQSTYLSILGLSSDSERVPLTTTGVEGEISRDVDRTFPMHPLFADDGDGQRQLANVLKATSVYVPEIGYCQGMNYVAAALLIHFNEHDTKYSIHNRPVSPQEAAFWLLVAWIRRFDMADVWRSKMPGLSRCIHLYQQLLRRHFYDLHRHLKQIGMHPSLLVTQWFATLFARVLSVEVLVRVWELVLVDGWKMVYRIALAITAHVRHKLLHMDMEECSEYLRKHPRLELETLTADALITSAMGFKLTRAELARLDDERHLEYLRLRLQQAPLSHDDALLFPTLQDDGTLTPSESLAFIRAQLEQLDADTASDLHVLRRKIEAIDRVLATATASLAQWSYALSDASFALAEHTTERRKCRKTFDALRAEAVREASSPRASAQAKRQQLTGVALWRLWTPTLSYVQQRLAGCLERLPIGSLTMTGDEDDEEEEQEGETRRHLTHLELLVPARAPVLHALFNETVAASRAVARAARAYDAAKLQTQLAQVQVEEAQQFKDRLADQMVQLMLAAERVKNAQLQRLFQQVDEQRQWQ